MNNNFLLPGDHIASIEEFESGKNTYEIGGSVRSSALGTGNYDLKYRSVSINRKNTANFPKIGDEIIGYIEMLFSSMISIRILYINNKKLDSGLSAISSTRISDRGGFHSRRDRERRPRLVYRVGDIVRGRVFSLMNSSSHATIDDKNLGILYCLCNNCGGDTVKLNTSIKCVDCGMTEEKKLSSDFGKQTLITLSDRQIQ
jgi:exosome complex component CSL4